MFTNMPLYSLLLFLFILSSCGIQIPQNKLSSGKQSEYNKMSQDLLERIENNEEVLDLQTSFVELNEDKLISALKTDEQKKAFWLNIYNAYVIVALKRDPKQYEDRGTFFTKKQINIAGHLLSFDDIENGMLRKSQLKYGLGYISKPFRPNFERKLRLVERDYRIHFALNCGANSCPPVQIYKAETVNMQLQKSSETYLKKYSKYSANENKVITTPLTKWFKGDFGGEKGIKEILKDSKIIPKTTNPTVEYGNYDWTININNFDR